MKTETKIQVSFIKVYLVRINDDEQTRLYIHKHWYGKHEGDEYKAVLVYRRGFRNIAQVAFRVVDFTSSGQFVRPVLIRHINPIHCTVVNEQLVSSQSYSSDSIFA